MSDAIDVAVVGATAAQGPDTYLAVPAAARQGSGFGVEGEHVDSPVSGCVDVVGRHLTQLPNAAAACEQHRGCEHSARHKT